MKIILLENVRKVGSIGEIIDVKRGFARNYLISKKKALFASTQNIKEVEKIKQDLSKKDEDRKKEAKTINEKIKNIDWDFNQDFEFEDNISKGKNVYHQKFGNGKIIKLDGDKALIDFENFSSKKVYLKFLKIID